MRDPRRPMRIDLTVVGPDGTARDVAVLARPGTRWADIAPLLPGPGAETGTGPTRPGAARLGRDGLHDGAVVDMTGAPRGPASAAGGHRLDVVGGPDAGRSRPLGRAPVTVGRATDCDLVLSDPNASRHHARVGLTPTGALVRDCGSATGTTVGTVRVGGAPAPVGFADYLRVGDSFLRVTAPGGDRPAATRPGPDGTVLVLHAGDASARVDGSPASVAEIDLPEPPPPTVPQRVQWLAAAVPAVVGAGLALAMHAPGFLLFALLTPLTLLGSALGERLHRRRDGRRRHRSHRAATQAARARVAAALADEAAGRRAAAPDPVTVATRATLPGTGLWCRAADGPGGLTVRLGLGDLPARARVRDRDGPRPAGTLRAVPVVADLARGPLGLAGPFPATRPIARWILAQLAAAVPPGELEVRLLLSPAAEPRWRWARWLPQLAGPPAVTAADRARLVADLQADPAAAAPGHACGLWRVLILDDDTPAVSTPGLAELLHRGGRPGLTAVALGASAAALPAGCSVIATVAGDTGTRMRVQHGSGAPVPFVADRVSEAWCEGVSRALAPLRAGGSPAGLPRSCGLVDLLGSSAGTPPAVLARWRRADTSLAVPIGVAAEGPLRLDLVGDGPHALIAGTTGAGKSELLRSLVTGLALEHSPDEVGLVLVDYKGGAAFAECGRLPHTLGVVTDLDAHLAARALVSLDSELRRREQLFAAAGARDFAAYRAGPAPSGPALPRLVIVVDEFAELATELADFVTGLVGIARRGRSLGVHLVLATQRPAGVVSPEIRANTAVRIALRVTDAADSRDVIDVPDAAALDPERPGLAYLRLAGGPPVRFQAALAGGPVRAGTTAPRVLELDGWRRPARPGPDRPGPGSHPASDPGLAELVDVVAAAARLGGYAEQPRPWLPPLPVTLRLSDLPDAGPGAVTIGLADHPREQRQVPLTVDLGGGSVLIAGGPRSGRTTALLTLAGAAAARSGPDELHVHALDHAGHGLGALAGLPHLGSLISDDPAAASRLLARLADQVAARRGRADAGEPDPPALLLLLDGWEQFLAAAEQHDSPQLVEALLALLRTGPAAGLTVAVTGDRGALAPRLAAAMRTKLVLPLTDRGDYALAGITPSAAPADPPPGRAVRAEDGVEIQLAHLGPSPPAADTRRALEAIAARWPAGRAGPEPVRVRSLPTAVRLGELNRPMAAGPGPGPVLVGVGGDGTEPLAVDLFRGRRRLLILGPPGSGRSSALLALFVQLAGRATGSVLVAATEHSPLAAAARAAGVALLGPDGAPAGPGPDVLLVDDCERFGTGSAGERLTAWAASPAGPVIVAAGCGDELAVAFRGLAAQLRRARCGLLLRPGPGDGELLGLRGIPRRTGSPPGRGLLVGDPAWGPQFAAGPVPIQVALP